MTRAKFKIIGGGLAGCEAAWQCLQHGFAVDLYEMRLHKSTPAHQSSDLAELVCSNSLKSEDPASAPGLLKSEMLALDSLIIRSAKRAKVPAGNALAVDRKIFSQEIYQSLCSHPQFSLKRETVDQLPSVDELAAAQEFCLVATGPLTDAALAQSIRDHIEGGTSLYFYDAIAPVIDADSIDMSIAFRGDRYGEPGQGDYLNLPMDKGEYQAFIDAIAQAEMMPLHSFEEPKYFESCLPIEVMLSRGKDTLRFGPMKPVGFVDPRTGKRPYALIQLRAENRDATMYSMVGFQTKMKWPEQKRVFRDFVPGLKEADFFRFGSVHRNTYIQSPVVLDQLRLKSNPRIAFAGQITGVEGYTESSAIGLLAARMMITQADGRNFVAPPKETVLGALWSYVTEAGPSQYQPMNANFGLLPPLEETGKKIVKKLKRQMQSERAQKAMGLYLHH